jgi:hypothetical protein
MAAVACDFARAEGGAAARPCVGHGGVETLRENFVLSESMEDGSLPGAGPRRLAFV